MRNKLLSVALSLIIVLSLCTALPCSAQAQADGVARAQSIVDGVIAYKTSQAGVSDARELLNGQIADEAGSSEWYALSLIQIGQRDTEDYCAALERYLADAPTASAQSRQKYALLLLASGATDSAYIADVMESSIGESGLMSYVFALHLMNNGCESSRYSASEVIDAILSLRQSDGGWAVLGTASDVDATAMTLQALAVHTDDSDVSEAVEDALSFLSERQRDSGGYASFGAENPESAAQVLCALSALGADAASDGRFIKNGNTVFDALETFRLPDGSFSHTLGGAASDSATVQSLYGAIAYLRMSEGKSGFFILDDVSDEPAFSETESSDAAPVSPSSAETGSDGGEGEHRLTLKVCLAVGVVLVAVLLCVILGVAGRLRKKTLCAVAAAAAILLLLLAVCDIRTADDYYGSTDATFESVGQVTMSVRCDTLIGKSDAEHIPSDGVVLGEKGFSVGESTSAYDVLVAAAKENKITLDVASGGYVRGIAGIYELEFGELSGWMFFVNGTAPSVSAAEYILSDGDCVEWRYTCELGRDIE